MEGECCLFCDGKTHYASSPGRWARYITKWKHTTIINTSYVLNLHTHYRWRIEYFWLSVTDSWQLKTLKHITNKLENLLDNNITFPQALGGKLLLVSKEPPTNLNQILISNNKQHTYLCQYENQTLQNLKCLFWPFIYINNSITGLSKYTKDYRYLRLSTSNGINIIISQHCSLNST